MGTTPDLSTGKKVIEFARGRGAHIRTKGRFWTIKTPKGTMKILPSDDELDFETKNSIIIWLKLLGILMIIAVLVFMADSFLYSAGINLSAILQ